MEVKLRVFFYFMLVYSCVILSYPIVQQYHYKTCRSSALYYIFFNDSLYCAVLAEILKVFEGIFMRQRADFMTFASYLNV